MKLNTIITFATSLILASTATRAAVHIWEDPSGWTSGLLVYETTETPRYTANELSLDLSGSFIANETHLSDLFDTNIRHGKWGGDVGLNYFLTRNVGIGADMEMSDNGGNFIDMVLGNLILRLPLGSSGLAPYVFGGGGRGTDQVWEWVGHAGVGLEFRFNPNLGLFTDGRYIWHDKEGSVDRLLLRAGLRLVF